MSAEAETSKNANTPAKSGNKAVLVVLLISTVVGGIAAFALMHVLMPAQHQQLPPPPKVTAPAKQAAPAPQAAPQAAPAAGQPAAAGAPGNGAAALPAKPTTPTVALKAFVVTLNEPGTPRYLKVTLKVELESHAAADELKSRDAEIRDHLILYLSSLTLSKTQGIRAKQEIRGQIVHRINAVLEKGKASRVFISEFMTQ